MFVKVCGLRRVEDATAAVAAGVDAVGLNFVPASRRCIDLATARAILAVVPDHVMTVGVFRDHAGDEMLTVTDTLGLDAAQLHGDERPETTAAVAAGVGTVIKVFPAGSRALDEVPEHQADIVMIDAPTPGGGVPFDWGVIGDLAKRCRLVLAGGLTPDNVAEAIRLVRPWGVDVASGVENERGDKVAATMQHFVATARATEGR